MMVYNVGDKVKIRTDLISDKDYGGYEVVDEMMCHLGKLATITVEYNDSYDIDLDGGMYFWTDEMFEPAAPATKETVNHPSHYNMGIEAIDYIESHNMNFNMGNVIKYVTRAKYKGTELEDLKKASWYLNREIENLEKEGKK